MYVYMLNERDGVMLSNEKMEGYHLIGEADTEEELIALLNDNILAEDYAFEIKSAFEEK